MYRSYKLYFEVFGCKVDFFLKWHISTFKINKIYIQTIQKIKLLVFLQKKATSLKP